jgi:hypothetical protein
MRGVEGLLAGDSQRYGKQGNLCHGKPASFEWEPHELQTCPAVYVAVQVRRKYFNKKQIG